MKVLILGDVHGMWSDLNITIARALKQHPDITHMIQVGDFGYAWPGSDIQANGTGFCKPFTFHKAYMDPSTIAKAEALPFYWIDGNHENHDQLEKDQGAFQSGMIYQPRGSVLRLTDYTVMFFGGASSIDKDHRIQGKSWWPQESITYRQVMEALDYQQTIDLVISHEFPFDFPYGSYKKEFGRSDKQALNAIRGQFKPRHWVFGHHHTYQAGETEGTTWACAPCIEQHQAILWNGESLELLYC